MGNKTMTDAQPQLLQAIVDAMDEQVAIVESDGRIVFVNAAWRFFWSWRRRREAGIHSAEGQSAGPQSAGPHSAGPHSAGPHSAGLCDLAQAFPLTEQPVKPPSLGAESLHEGKGANYYDCCNIGAGVGNPHADAVTEGIQSVLAGEEDFFVADFPCHVLQDRHWFCIRVLPLEGEFDRPLFLIGHKDVSNRYLADEQSLQDPLTGLPNHRKLHEFLYYEWQRCIRSQHWISLVSANIDHLAAYNERWGHLEGDHALQEIAQVLRRGARRPSDIVIRFGEDKFLIVLGDTVLADAVRLTETLREQVRDLCLEYEPGKFLTLSAGVVSHLPQRGEIETLLLERADKALRVAKQRGRNRSDVHTPPGPPRISHPEEVDESNRTH